MSCKAGQKSILARADMGSPISHELCGEYIVSRLFGIIPYRRIHLRAIDCMRLATHCEVPAPYLFLNWPHFMSFKKRLRPVYVLQPRASQNIYLKLDGQTHFKLRQAIGRHSKRASGALRITTKKPVGGAGFFTLLNNNNYEGSYKKAA